ncbi:hypothetical protein ABT127_12570 [Streptomyces sp. NPDC001904]|uniref:hypothetical protein n=1 Tax=Streptomyces sp. NPDC001904 TaxID=3154531 RepID=UPI003330DAE1
MSDQRPAQRPAPRPGPRWGHTSPRRREISDGYRRRATLLTQLALTLGGVMAVAAVISLVLVSQADADTDGGSGAYGYLALFLWFGILAAAPVLVAVAVPAAVMARRVRLDEAAGTGG